MSALSDVDQPKRAHPPSEAQMAGWIEDAAILLGLGVRCPAVSRRGPAALWWRSDAGSTRLEAMLQEPARSIRAEHRLPPVRVRPLTAADAPLLRRWTIAPEDYVRIEDLLACAEVPGTVTLVGLDAEAPPRRGVPVGAGGLRRRRNALGLAARASWPAASGIRARDLARRARRTVCRRPRAARRHRPREHRVAALLRGVRVRDGRPRRVAALRGARPSCTRARRRRGQSASTPAIALRPTSMTSHTRPAWNGSPAAKRAGTVNPSVFLPSRQTGEVPTR